MSGTKATTVRMAARAAARVAVPGAAPEAPSAASASTASASAAVDASEAVEFQLPESAVASPTPSGAVSTPPSPGVTRVGYAPIVRVDPVRREIELCATSEALDSYGTIFAYEASRDAFDRWAGNVREMHERKAIGRRVAVRADDAERRLFVRVRISKGAQDTWEKVLDGTLRGASIGASNVEWRKERRGDREVPVARRYDLVELSLVDLPSNPDALGVTFVRDGVPVADVLDEIGDDAEAEHAFPPKERAASIEPSDLRAASDGLPGERAVSDESPEVRIARAALEAGRAQIARWVDMPLPWSAEELAVLAPDIPPADPRAAPSAAPRATRLAALGAPDYAAPEYAALNGRDVSPVPAPLRAPGSPLHRDGEGLGVRSPDHAHDGESGSRLRGHAEGLGSPTGGLGVRFIYRVADGALCDERLVPLAARQTGEYVGAAAFRAVGGVPGQGLTPERAWLARTIDLLESERAQGAFSDNPDGPPDVGVPARAEERPTAALGQTPAGNATAVFHSAARAILTGCGCPTCQGALALLDADGDERPDASGMGEAAYGRSEIGTDRDRDRAGARHDATTAAVVTRALEAHTRRLDGAIGDVRAGVDRLADALGEFDRRLAVVEAQPLPGGPHLRVADKTHALAPAGGPGQGDIGERLRALESLAGRLSDPQAQIAIATEMIRLQQEAAGLPAAFQVMPRAGQGPGGGLATPAWGANTASRRGA